MAAMEMYYPHPKTHQQVWGVWLSCELHQSWLQLPRRGLDNLWTAQAHNWERQGTGQAILLMDNPDSRPASAARRQAVITIWLLHLPTLTSFFYFCEILLLASASASQWTQMLNFLNLILVPWSHKSFFHRWYAVKHLRIKSHDICSFHLKDSPQKTIDI